jgi:hypothetical protein
LYPLVGYPRIAEFRTMVTHFVVDQAPGDWTGLFFYALATVPKPTTPTQILFRAHDNGITLALSVSEWKTVHTLFERAWDNAEIRAAWIELELQYGEM